MSSILKRRRVYKAKTACSIHGCDKLTNGLSIYCAKHKKFALYNGDPNMRAIRLKELTTARSEVKLFLKVHAKHPAVQTALDWLNETVEFYATRGAPFARGERRPITYPQRLGAELYRLKSQGCTALEILETVCVVFRFTSIDMRRLPRFTKQHDFATARLVLNLRDRFSKRFTDARGRVQVVTSRPSSILLSNFGNLLNRTLINFLIEMNVAIDRHNRKEEALKAQLAETIKSTPFEPCTPVEVVA